MEKKYTSERNIQILISLLKKHDIKKIIVSPGSTNINFVASVQNDDFFKLYSCVDERSAAYMACGLAADSNEPVIITCTGATASRDYMPGLTEAYYRKLPVIAITATQHLGRIGQNIPQVIDRRVPLNDIVKKSIQLTSVYSKEDEWDCNTKVNDVLLECRRHGGGPVHINMITTYSNTFNCTKLSNERKIDRIGYNEKFPEINYNKIAINIGNHKIFSDDEIKKIEEFCEKYNAVVICDHTSNYNGKYKILGNLSTVQPSLNIEDLKEMDLLIDIGNISGAYMNLKPRNVWRVNEDGEIRDTFKKITIVFEMDEKTFFEKYNVLKTSKEEMSYFKSWLDYNNKLIKKIDDNSIPFSNIWIAKNLINKIDDKSIVHLGILNTLRSWNFFENNKYIKFYCNTGGFGIDGIMSTALGASLNEKGNVYCILGDLAFFYDLNSIGNREVGSNLRVLLINNGTGTEFHNYNHRADIISKENKLDLKYFAADGHFGNKSKKLVKHYSEDLGFDYLFAYDKKQFLENIIKFTCEANEKPIIFEVFTNAEDESKALKIINNLEIDTSAKGIAKNMIGDRGIKFAKKILKK